MSSRPTSTSLSSLPSALTSTSTSNSPSSFLKDGSQGSIFEKRLDTSAEGGSRIYSSPTLTIPVPSLSHSYSHSYSSAASTSSNDLYSLNYGRHSNSEDSVGRESSAGKRLEVERGIGMGLIGKGNALGFNFSNDRNEFGGREQYGFDGPHSHGGVQEVKNGKEDGESESSSFLTRLCQKRNSL